VGVRDVIEDYHNGRLLKEMDKQSFVDALIWALYRAPEELKAMKQFTTATVRKYSIRTSADSVLRLYENIRSKKSVSMGKKNSSQYLLLWRLRAEWDIFWNYTRSVLTSIFKGDFNKTEPREIKDTTKPLPGDAGDSPAEKNNDSTEGLRKGEKDSSILDGEPDLYVMTEDGKRIAFSHIKRGFDKVVIIAHGFYSNKDTFLFKQLTEAFSKEYDVIVFDFRGHGKSSDVFTWTALEQKDLRAIIAYAKERNYAKIGVIGFSLGAAIVLVEASSQKSIDSVIAVSCPADLRKINYHFWEKEMWKELMINMGIKGRGKGVKMGSLSLQKNRPKDIVGKISPIPVLFIHGEKDWIIKPRHSQLLFDEAKSPKALSIIKEAGHAERIFDVFPDQFMKICLDRFRDTLKG